MQCRDGLFRNVRLLRGDDSGQRKKGKKRLFKRAEVRFLEEKSMFRKHELLKEEKVGLKGVRLFRGTEPLRIRRFNFRGIEAVQRNCS